MRLPGSIGVIVVCGIAACGDHGNAPRDGAVIVDAGEVAADAPIDVAIDAPPPPTRVRVLVRNAFRPFAGVTVLFQRPDDSVIADVMTDDHGVAEVELPEGGTVSVLPIYSDGVKDVITYLGVKPGDVLEVGSPPQPEQTPIDTVTLQLPPGSPRYMLTTRCLPFAIQLDQPTVAVRPCGSPTNFAVLDDARSTLYTDLLTLTEGQVVDLTGVPFRPPHTITVRAEHMPAPLLAPPSVSTETTDHGLEVSSKQERVVRVTDATAETSFEIADVPSVKVTTAISVLVEKAGVKLWNRRQAPRSPVVFDVAQIDLPFMRDAAYDGNTLRWTELGPGHADLAYGILFLKRGTGLERVRIEIFGPRSGTTLRVPTFPAPYADRNATAEDVPAVFRAGIARMTGGWDVARRYVQRDDFFGFDWLDGDFVFSE